MDGQGTARGKYVKVQRRVATPQRKRDLMCALAKEDWSSLLKDSNVHSQVEKLHKTINNYLDVHCPYKTCKVRHDQPKWITPAILELMRAREAAYKENSAEHKKLQAEVQSMIRSSKQKFLSSQLNKDQNTKDWWKAVKALTSNQTTPNESTVVIDGKRICGDELCKNLNDYYRSVGGERFTDSEGTTPENAETSLQHVDLGKIKHLINKIDETKACSSKDFPVWVTKEAKEDLCIPLQHIINTMLDSGEFPDYWKQAEVRPLPKSTKPSQYKDYRPISLLFHLGKLAEQVIIDQMRGKLSEIIKPDQYAYQSKIGTVDALLQLVDDITSELDGTGVNCVQLASLDFSKAFDRLQPSIVINKMKLSGFNPKIINIVSSFLQKRSQCVKLNAASSDYTPIDVGAPQGTKLGPLLWLIYINDLQIDGYKSVKYADDSSFYVTIPKNSSNNITSAIQQTKLWSADNNMLLNTDKTAIINFSLNHRKPNDDPVTFDQTTITPSESVKFLGILVDNHLTFIDHVEHLVKKCNSKLFLMRQLRKVGMDKNGLKTYYCTNIRSVLAYASPVFYNFLSDTTKSKLEHVQDSATKIIEPDLEYPDRLKFLELPSLCDFISSFSESLFRKIASNEMHPLFSRIILNQARTSSRLNTMYRPPKCRTQKRLKSFFPHYMSALNK